MSIRSRKYTAMPFQLKGQQPFIVLLFPFTVIKNRFPSETRMVNSSCLIQNLNWTGRLRAELHCAPSVWILCSLQYFYDSYFQSESARYRFTEAASIWIMLIRSTFCRAKSKSINSPKYAGFFVKMSIFHYIWAAREYSKNRFPPRTILFLPFATQCAMIVFPFEENWRIALIKFLFYSLLTTSLLHQQQKGLKNFP